MARILIAWELGGGLGHLAPIQQVAKHFIQRGHDVWIASKDLDKVRQVFENLPIKLVQAPRSMTSLNTSSREKQAVTCGFGELLHQVGYSSFDALYGMVSAWHNLIQLITPDLLMVDHSPTALLASRNMKVPKIAIGASFSIPDSNNPCGLFFHTEEARTRAEVIEKKVVENINTVCQSLAIKGIYSLNDIFNDLNKCIFQLYPELDHYGLRRPSNQMEKIAYVGTTSPALSDLPDFPNTQGVKIFCYVKWHSSVPILFKALQSIQCSAIVVSSGIPDKVIQEYRAKHILYTKKAVNIQAVLQQADLGIGNATMNTMAQFLKAGIPLAMIPLYTEQLLGGRKAEALGAGVFLNFKNHQTLIKGLQRACGLKAKLSASAFAKKYQTFNPQKALTHQLTLIEQDYLNSFSIERPPSVPAVPVL